MRQLRAGLWSATLAACAFIDVLSLVDASNHVAALATALVPFTIVVASGSLAIAMGFRRWLFAVPSAGLLFVAAMVTMSPGSSSGFLVEPIVAAENEEGLVVVSSNVRAGNDQFPDLIAEMVAASPDVVVFIEVTDVEMATIRSSSLAESHPHVIADPRDGYFGSAIVSRFPLLGGVTQIGGYPMIDATVATTDGDVALVGVHVAPPISAQSFELWTEQLSALETRLRVANQPTVLIGDFNGTPHHRRLRRLAAVSTSSALGVAPTYSVASWAPPLLSLDHVFSAGGACIDGVTTVDASGSDHRALRAVVRPSYSPDGSCR